MRHEGSTMTNATKALIIAFVNAVLGMLTAFDVALTSGQQAAILGLVNTGLALWIGVTYKASPKRIPD